MFLKKNYKNFYNSFNKALLSKKGIIAPGCGDPLSAKLIQKKKFKFIFIGGFTLSSSQYGYPDAGLITLSELVDAAKKIQNSVNIPCIVDADTGFGGVVNVHRTVRDLANLGVAALTIEDQQFPKKCALTKEVKILDFNDACQRIKVAVNAAKINKKKDIGIIARTDAYSLFGIEEAAKRIKIYKSLGADAVFVTGINTKEDLIKISKYKNLNLMINIHPKIKFKIDDLKKYGIKITIYSQSILNGYIDSTNFVLEKIKNGSIPKSKNLSKNTLDLLDFKKFLQIEKNS